MIKVFTGKGGVGKTTCASYYALSRASEGLDAYLLSIDPMHSLADSFGLRKSFTDNPLKSNEWISLWSFKPWKQFDIKSGLYLKQVTPTKKDLELMSEDKLLSQLYTPYEVIAGQELMSDKGLLIIDTDSLEGLTRLLNYANEHELIKNKLLKEGEIIPVTTLERASLDKISDLWTESIMTNFPIKQLFINHTLPSDNRLSLISDYYSFRNAELTILYEQLIEPVGPLMSLLTKPTPLRKQVEVISDGSIPKKKAYLICGKGGQGKSTMACALAVRLAESGERVKLVSADARTSLEDVLDERVGFISDDEAFKDLSTTEQYSGLRLEVRKQDRLLSQVPGYDFMISMLGLINRDDYTLIIDAPPSGNIIKNVNQGLPGNDLITKLINRFDLWQLKRRGKQGFHDFLIDRARAYERGLELMSDDEFIAVPVTQLTNTALVETNNLISTLYSYDINPYRVYADYYGEAIGKSITKKPMIINRVKGLKDLSELFPDEEFDLVLIPELSEEPIGREALSDLGKLLIK